MAVLTSWPKDQLFQSAEKRAEVVALVEADFSKTLESLKVDIGLVDMLESIYVPMAAWIMEHKSRHAGPLVVGINGAQGSGKSTLFNLLEVTLALGFEQRVVGFSLDDIYKTHAARERLAVDVHPLLVTRGVPGTHDVDLGISLLEQLREAREGSVVKIPVFDKSIDDRCPERAWQEWLGPVDVVVVDGWCLGAKHQSEQELLSAVNELEAKEDPDAVWRRYVNDQLRGPYQQLFDQVDLLIMLKVPSMEAVFEWRTLQEKKLAERVRFLGQEAESDELKIMSEREIHRFIMHYERLTRMMLEQMPEEADVTSFLNKNHKVFEILINRPLAPR
ncbi:MAG: D-glycerate 3-kinase [Motiliproteus sp.]|jgi:D-glycerate 3-kinase